MAVPGLGWIDKLPAPPRRSYGVRVVVAIVVVAIAGGLVAVTGERALLDCPEGGVVAVETAFTAARAASLVTDCADGEISDHVRADLVFMVVYGAALALVCLVFGPWGYRMRRLREASRLMAGLAALAAVFDAIETLIIGRTLGGSASNAADLPDVWFNLMAMAAWSKFILLVPVIPYAVIAVCGFVSMPHWIRFDGAYPEDPDAGADGQDDPPPETETGDEQPEPSAAIALSGGGVRSAVFGLGGLQALDDTPLGYDTAERVTSVSGGGYMAGGWALGRLPIDDLDATPEERAGAWRDPGAALRRQGAVSAEERHLADNLGYLTKSRRGRPGAIVTVLSGVVVNIAVLMLVLFVFSRPIGWVVGSESIAPTLRLPYGDADRVFDAKARHWGPPLLAAATAVGSLVLWVGASRVFRFERLSRLTNFFHERLRPFVFATSGLAIVLTLLLLVIPWAMIEVPQALNVADGDSSERGLVASITAAAGAAGSIAGALRSRFGALLKRLGGFLLLAGAVFVGGQWATNAAINGPDDDVTLWAVCAVIVAVGYLIANPEWWSLAPFYRGRLRLAYAYSRDKADQEEKAYNGGDEPLLAALRPDPGPMPYFCAAVHVRSSNAEGESVHHDTNPALSLTMSPDLVSIHEPRVNERSWVSESCDPQRIAHLMWKSENPRLNVFFAAAVSGAAVAPALGRMTVGSTDMLLAFANVRLGVWIPNPRHAKGVPSSALTAATNTHRLPRVRIGYLLKEFFGLHDPDDLYVYATDGGHWENTAIVEALRGSAVSEITAFDGSGVTADKTTPLAEAVNLAALELGDELDIDIEMVRAEADETRGGRLARRNVAVGIIRRRDGGLGVLWYARPTLTSHSSAGLKAYAEREPDFPSHSTLDQFFDREQFENYRLLGFEAGRTIVRARSKVQLILRDAEDLASFKRAARSARGAGVWAVRELSSRVHDETDYAQLRTLLTPEGGWPDDREDEDEEDDEKDHDED